jgi:hypothetical protein
LTTHTRLKRVESSIACQRREALRFLTEQMRRPDTRLASLVERQRTRAAALGATEPNDPALTGDAEFQSLTAAVCAECLRLTKRRFRLIYLFWRSSWSARCPGLLEAEAEADEAAAVVAVPAAPAQPGVDSATVAELPAGPDPGPVPPEAAEW